MDEFDMQEIESELVEYRLIRVKDHGSEGLSPVLGSGCPYQLKESDKSIWSSLPSCISGSGGSLCGGFWGDVTVEGRKYVKCIFTEDSI